MAEGNAAETIAPEQQTQLVATGKLFTALAADPKYRKRVLALIKEAAPDVPIPELEIEQAISKEVETHTKANADEVKKLTDKVDTLERKLVREAWRAENGLSEEECLEVEKLAKEGQIGKAETALEFFRAKQAIGVPRGTRRAPAGAKEYLDKLGKISPRHTNQLKQAAFEEVNRILSTRKTG